MKHFYFEAPISQSLIDEPEFDLLAYLDRQFTQDAYARETDPCANEETYPLNAYRCVKITGPMEQGQFTPPRPGVKVYGGEVERDE